MSAKTNPIRSDLQLDVQKRVRTWAPRRADIASWASEALGRRAANREVSVRLVGRAESRKLNARYRGKDHATNVLSFPASPLAAPPLAASASDDAAQPLGDLVICPPVLRAEALEQRKPLRAHWAHLVVHGSLHLIVTTTNTMPMRAAWSAARSPCFGGSVSPTLSGYARQR